MFVVFSSHHTEVYLSIAYIIHIRGYVNNMAEDGRNTCIVYKCS